MSAKPSEGPGCASLSGLVDTGPKIRPKSRIVSGLGIFPLVFALVSAFGAGAEDVSRAELPPELREASGLAVVDRETVVLHNDESGAIYTLDLDTLAVTGRSGNRRYAGDFEGVALAKGFLFLSDSRGDLYRYDVRDTGDTRTYALAAQIETGLGNRCEFEGLAASGDLLLLPCKHDYAADEGSRLTIFAYSLVDEAVTRFLSLERSQISGARKLRPTAIEAAPGRLLVLSNRQLIDLDLATHESRVYKLSKKRHPQPEGLTLLEDGRLVIVDDRKKETSYVTVYAGIHVFEEKR